MPSSWASPRVLAFAAALACGCGGREPAAAPDTELGALAQLQGSWRLLEYEPNTPFEPTLRDFIGAQNGQLVATVAEDKLHVEGAGFARDVEFRVKRNLFTRVDLLLATGADEVSVSAIIDGDKLRFECLTAPWDGRGRMARVRELPLPMPGE
jgi:hypothetical protein